MLIRGATPPIADAFRLLAQSSLSTRWNDTQNTFYAIGSDSGLRGYNINEFIGERYFNLQIEGRTAPYPIWVLRVGGVAFYDLGGAANSLATMALHQDVGLGARLLIPQTLAELHDVRLRDAARRPEPRRAAVPRRVRIAVLTTR